MLDRMGGAEAEFGDDGVVPATVLDSVRETLNCVDELRGNLERFLTLAEPDVLAELTPLQRARAFLVLATSASALFSVRLGCSGIRADDHPIRTEIDRLGLHEDKLRKYNDWNKAPLRPSVKINPQAAARFIEHSLPDLAPEQRRSLHEISSRRSFINNRVKKKAKYQSSDKQSVRAATHEFLEKAARELFGSNDSSVKGPLQNLSSDDEHDE
ncbi:hypothetical protein KSP40_PGU016817 [Platanthera guangdongensis]|uniref:Nuclear nucleic acid-binding protein C1D n=1 Tax=Platanthera guangdongensis TaxID=2320717 RepID=A0ABR2LSJ0_9ASPA